MNIIFCFSDEFENSSLYLESRDQLFQLLSEVIFSDERFFIRTDGNANDDNLVENNDDEAEFLKFKATTQFYEIYKTDYIKWLVGKKFKLAKFKSMGHTVEIKPIGYEAKIKFSKKETLQFLKLGKLIYEEVRYYLFC